ncbi:MAG: HAD family phosphatase [Erysipelotrichia bacterium]|nr:HAD family phosphatase [Erysipelotrichia bacterium]
MFQNRPAIGTAIINLVIAKAHSRAASCCNDQRTVLHLNILSVHEHYKRRTKPGEPVLHSSLLRSLKYMKLKGCVTDFNGTLFFDTPLHVSTWNEMALELTGHGITAEEMQTRYCGMNNLETLRELCPGRSEDWYTQQSEEKERRYRRAALSMPGGPHLTPGAAEAFDWLKEHHIPLAMATASIKENVDFYVRTFRLDRWISAEHIIYDDGKHTDKVSMFKEAAAGIHCGTSVLILEDSLSGIKAASALEEAEIAVIESPILKQIYPQYPKIVKVLTDFTDIIPLLEELF